MIDQKKYDIKGISKVIKIDKFRYVKIVKITSKSISRHGYSLDWGIHFTTLDKETYRPYVLKFALSEEGLSAMLHGLMMMGGNRFHV